MGPMWRLQLIYLLVYQIPNRPPLLVPSWFSWFSWSSGSSSVLQVDVVSGVAAPPVVLHRVGLLQAVVTVEN
jgi:hypothetical protein